MLQTLFHACFKARLLEQLPEEEQFLPFLRHQIFKSTPFKSLRLALLFSPFTRKGLSCAIKLVCAESYKAMLVINLKLLEGCSQILLVIPNADLLYQWTEMLERF